MKKTTITLNALIAHAGNIPESLIRAVVRQSGGWGAFTETAPAVANHGADCGFPGWIYCTETEAFARRNRAAIAQLAEDMAADFGEAGAVALVKGFRCLSDVTDAEIARALYGKPKDDDAPVANALAWFALEEVSRAYVDACDR